MRSFALVLVLTVPLLAMASEQAENKATVAVVYYSAKGHTQAMAEAVAKGARGVEGVTVNLKAIPEATLEDVSRADAVIVGSPVYKGNVAPRVQEFINSWPLKDGVMRNKIGAAFVTASGISAGEEMTQFDIIKSMLVCQMIIVGGPDAGQPFGASAVSESPYPKPADKKDEALVAEYYLKKGEALGKRVAELAVRMKK
jgi:NAD(P)H dehydrogenase (quinone)